MKKLGYILLIAIVLVNIYQLVHRYWYAKSMGVSESYYNSMAQVFGITAESFNAIKTVDDAEVRAKATHNVNVGSYLMIGTPIPEDDLK